MPGPAAMGLSLQVMLGPPWSPPHLSPSHLGWNGAVVPSPGPCPTWGRLGGRSAELTRPCADAPPHPPGSQTNLRESGDLRSQGMCPPQGAPHFLPVSAPPPPPEFPTASTYLPLPPGVTCSPLHVSVTPHRYMGAPQATPPPPVHLWAVFNPPTHVPALPILSTSQPLTLPRAPQPVSHRPCLPYRQPPDPGIAEWDLGPGPMLMPMPPQWPSTWASSGSRTLAAPTSQECDSDKRPARRPRLAQLPAEAEGLHCHRPHLKAPCQSWDLCTSPAPLTLWPIRMGLGRHRIARCLHLCLQHRPPSPTKAPGSDHHRAPLQATAPERVQRQGLGVRLGPGMCWA